MAKIIIVLNSVTVTIVQFDIEDRRKVFKGTARLYELERMDAGPEEKQN